MLFYVMALKNVKILYLKNVNITSFVIYVAAYAYQKLVLNISR